MSLKIKSIVCVWISLAISMLLTRTFWVSVLLRFIGICVTAHLLLLKTKKEDNTQV